MPDKHFNKAVLGFAMLMAMHSSCSQERRDEDGITECIRRSLVDHEPRAQSEMFLLLDNPRPNEQVADLQITTLGQLVFVIEDEDLQLPINARGADVSVFCREGRTLTPLSWTRDAPPYPCGKKGYCWRGREYKKVHRTDVLSIIPQHLPHILENLSDKPQGQKSLDGLWFYRHGECRWDGYSFRRCDRTIRIVDFGPFAVTISRNFSHWTGWLVNFNLTKPWGLVEIPAKKVQTGWQDDASWFLMCDDKCLVFEYDPVAIDEINKICATSCGNPGSSMVRIEPLWDDDVCEQDENPDLLTRIILSPY